MIKSTELTEDFLRLKITKKNCESLVVKRSETAALWNTIKSATNISRN
jgi:hypothetical protein